MKRPAIAVVLGSGAVMLLSAAVLSRPPSAAAPPVVEYAALEAAFASVECTRWPATRVPIMCCPDSRLSRRGTLGTNCFFRNSFDSV